MKKPAHCTVIEHYKGYFICALRSFNRGNKGKSGQQGLRGLQCLTVRKGETVFFPALFDYVYNPNTMQGRTVAIKKCRAFVDSLTET